MGVKIYRDGFYPVDRPEYRIVKRSDILADDQGRIVEVTHLIVTRGEWDERPERFDRRWVAIPYADTVVAYRVTL